MKGSPKYGNNENYDNRIWKGRIESSYRQLTDIEKGYIAAFLDGEGHVSFCHDEISGRRHVYWQIAFNNTYKPVLQYIQSLIGGRIQTRKRRINWKTSYMLYMRKQEVLNFLPQIVEYLQIKKKQAILLLEFLEFPHGFSEKAKEIYAFNRILNGVFDTKKPKKIFAKQELEVLGGVTSEQRIKME